jgi:PKD repeat protein
MRTIGMLAVVTGALVLAPAGSDDAGTPPPANTGPVADFAVPSCTINLACDFASSSTDDGAVTAWSWDFDGDGTPDATTATAAFTYTAAGTFSVSLTVRDAEDLSDTRTRTLIIDPAPSVNAAPLADFAVPQCTINVACDFASTSTDDEGVTGWSWDFDGDGNLDATAATTAYTYTTAGTFTVSLTVRDAQGLGDTKAAAITIAPPPHVNTPPAAGFTSTCTAARCSFTSNSTDAAPGIIASYAWGFGDGGTSTASNPSHTYAVTASTEFAVTLTVIDDEGATDSDTQTITVSPPPPGAEGCVTSGTIVDCALDIAARSTIKLKLLALSCDLRRQRLVVPPPDGDQLFLAICSRAAGDSTKIFGGPGDSAIIFEAGSQAKLRFGQGEPDLGETLAPPSAQLVGAFPTWTLNIEDGQHPGAPGEPDFSDVVVEIQAVPAP